MQIALIGWQGGGKSTLFTALTGSEPAAGAEAHPGVAEIPDEQLDRLHELYPPAKKIRAKVEYLDVAGLAATQKRSGLKRSLISHLQGASVLAPVIGLYAFGAADPAELANLVTAELRDLEVELLLSDLQTAEARRERIDRTRRTGQSVDRTEDAAIDEVLAALNAETPLREIDFAPERDRALRSFGFLTKKPLLTVINRGEEQDGEAIAAALGETLSGRRRATAVVDARLEAEIALLDEEDRAPFLRELGIERPASERVLQAGFALLGLIRFFTVGDDEVRSWPIVEGTPAVQAAGEIHSDLQRGFIRAEVVSSDDLLAHGSLAACRDKGLLRLEGKDYRVRDGDVMHVRFAV